MSKAMKKFIIWLAVIAVLAVLLLFTGPLYIVNEGKQVVITRFGSIVGSHTEAGLYVKVPFLDKITTYPKLVLSMDGDEQRIPTKENQYIIVDTTARWRIADPVKFYQNFVTLDNAYNKLSDIIDSSTRTVITQNKLSEVVRSTNHINEKKAEAADSEESIAEPATAASDKDSNDTILKGRSVLCREMTSEANKLVPEYGIDLIDIVPRQVKYSDELTDSVYSRMIKERNQVAQSTRSAGEGKKAEWLGRLESDKRTIASEAYRKSEEIKGNADAEAAAIYAAAYNKDPEFYMFWKSMESYKQNLKDYPATYSTNMDYFKYLYSPDGNR
ncbi:MAG: protease modulator HflC [Treponema sp.]|nr:protease modulator HflC [Treponema sp.]